MPHGSKYGNGIVIVQERQYRPSSTYSSGSSTTRYTTTSSGSGYYSSAMDSSSSSRSSSASNRGPDRTGTYRTGGADSHNTTVKHNTKGKREVVIVHHNTKNVDPAAPRSSERYRQ
ncbi:hypothetical protein GE09DRAFT_1056439 [Coniochaeta sp. 2T2.1]|nr:hypothetical protein GE09DRAFT_1056439 [Coniochaeta sp. 2T2.1]